ncbi:MAG: hypothetical protein IPO21_13770 [Bacteroidales bacterium]|nr:hypothetical protein [Bacteroidales bacterium]
MQFIENITKNRSKRVVNAVVEAIRNAETLTMDAALKRETELFCELAKQIESEDN